MRWIACLFAMIGAPAAANEVYENYDPSILEACMFLDGPGADRTACIGLGAADCVAREAGRETIGHGMCMTAERQHWDDILNEVYGVLIVQQHILHESLQAANPAFDNPVDVMRDMQRAWISYRDAACHWERLQWGGGTGAGAAFEECILRLTAEQTDFLYRNAQ